LGKNPAGAKAQIYWRDVAAADVLALASRLYGTYLLTAADVHTLAFEAVEGVTYIPIPAAPGNRPKPQVNRCRRLTPRPSTEFLTLLNWIAAAFYVAPDHSTT
jgi:hypothetical protein